MNINRTGCELLGEYEKIEYLLYNYKMMKINIENIQQEINYIRKQDGLKGMSYDGIKTSPTNETKSSTEITALENIEAVGKMEKKMLDAKLIMDKLDRTIEGLTETKRTIIIEKYIKGKQWWQVAAMVCYSERWCKELRSEAIRDIIIGICGDK